MLAGPRGGFVWEQDARVLGLRSLLPGLPQQLLLRRLRVTLGVVCAGLRCGARGLDSDVLTSVRLAPTCLVAAALVPAQCRAAPPCVGLSPGVPLPHPPPHRSLVACMSSSPSPGFPASSPCSGHGPRGPLHRWFQVTAVRVETWRPRGHLLVAAPLSCGAAALAAPECPCPMPERASVGGRKGCVDAAGGEAWLWRVGWGSCVCWPSSMVASGKGSSAN